jgi:hypothetical protein
MTRLLALLGAVALSATLSTQSFSAGTLTKQPQTPLIYFDDRYLP